MGWEGEIEQRARWGFFANMIMERYWLRAFEWRWFWREIPPFVFIGENRKFESINKCTFRCLSICR
jgi:hypothetical protein